MAYQNANKSNPKQNPGGQTRPAYAPRGGVQTPAENRSYSRDKEKPAARKPDWQLFFGEKVTGEDGLTKTRVVVEADGKWNQIGAVWLDPEGKKPLYMKVERDIPAGSIIAAREPFRGRA